MYELYLSLLQQKKDLDQQILTMQCNLYEKHKAVLDTKDSGTINVEDGDFKLTVVKRETVKVDQQLASVVGISFKRKFELDKTAYKKLTGEDKKRVDECLTHTPAKPSFKVEKIDGN